MTRYAMVIDLERCTGCRTCMVACKVENNTPEAHFWMYTFRYEEGEYPNTRVWFMPRPCMHCDNAPCVKVCPVGARYKRLDGLTATDWEGSHRARLESVPRETTVGQVVGEAVRAMQLPGRTFVQALCRGRELSHDETLDEAGIVTGDELELMPRVSAG